MFGSPFIIYQSKKPCTPLQILLLKLELNSIIFPHIPLYNKVLDVLFVERKENLYHVIFLKLSNVKYVLARVFCNLLTAELRVFQGWAWIVTSVQDSLQLQHVCTALSWTEKVLQQLINQCILRVSFIATFTNQICINYKSCRVESSKHSVSKISVLSWFFSQGKQFLCGPFMFLRVGVFVSVLAMQNGDALKVQFLINITFYYPLFSQQPKS